MSIQDIAWKIRGFSSTSVTRATRAAAYFGIIAAVTGPFLLLTVGGHDANNLPWYIWAITLSLLLLVAALGFLAFKRESHDAEDISISPRHR